MCVIGCHIFFILIVFRCVFIHIPFYGRGQIYSLASDIALVRSGPDVVILASSFGELSWELRANEWLMDWVHNEYCADDVIDGNYWRYYIKRNK